VDDAAGFICAVDDLRPLDRETYNPAYEIWERIRRVPPAARARVLEALEPGGVRALWRNSVGRYALDDERSASLFSDFALSDDFPTVPGQARGRPQSAWAGRGVWEPVVCGARACPRLLPSASPTRRTAASLTLNPQVVTFTGRCERMEFRRTAGGRADLGAGSVTGAAPWLRASPTAPRTRTDAFRARLFVHPRSGALYARLQLRWLLGLDAPASPSYCRVDVGLVTTPAAADAGADMTLAFAAPGAPALELGVGDLPERGWPAPRAGAWSPFSFSPRDYVRVAGPGIYVGCGYRAEAPGGALNEEDFVFFAFARETPPPPPQPQPPGK